MDITIDFHSGVPVYKQMVDALSSAIQVGDLKVGDRLPPIRKLSDQLGVNPNTIAKVYRELELKGLIESKVGSGSYVLPVHLPALTPSQKQERLRSLLELVRRESRKLQIAEGELLDYLKARMAK